MRRQSRCAADHHLDCDEVFVIHGSNFRIVKRFDLHNMAPASRLDDQQEYRLILAFCLVASIPATVRVFFTKDVAHRCPTVAESPLMVTDIVPYIQGRSWESSSLTSTRNVRVRCSSTPVVRLTSPMNVPSLTESISIPPFDPSEIEWDMIREHQK